MDSKAASNKARPSSLTNAPKTSKAVSNPNNRVANKTVHSKGAANKRKVVSNKGSKTVPAREAEANKAAVTNKAEASNVHNKVVADKVVDSRAVVNKVASRAVSKTGNRTNPAETIDSNNNQRKMTSGHPIHHRKIRAK